MVTTSQMNAGEARVADPVLSTAAQGYRNARFIWQHIFPPVPVIARGGKIVKFGTEHFQEMDLRRAPGGRVPDIDIGYESGSYSCEQRSLNGKVPFEWLQDARAVPNIDLGMVASDRVMEAVHLQIEIEAASMIVPTRFVGRTEALAGAAQWSHADAKPAKAVREKFSTIRAGIGREPNTLSVSSDVNDVLINQPDIVDRVKHTQPAVGDAIDNAVLAKYFGVEHYCVGAAMKGKAGNFVDIWDNMALLHYSDVTALSSMGSPSLGYTYRLMGYPMVEAPYRDKGTNSWKYPITTEDTPQLVGAPAGFLFTNVVG